MIFQELDVIHLLKTIQKLKAGLSAIINDDKKVIAKSRQIYWRNAMIGSEPDQNEFFKFLDSEAQFTIFDNVKEKKQKTEVKERKSAGLSIKDYLRRKQKRHQAPQETTNLDLTVAQE